MATSTQKWLSIITLDLQKAFERVGPGIAGEFWDVYGRI